MRTKLGKSLGSVVDRVGVVIKMEEVMQDTDDECTVTESNRSVQEVLDRSKVALEAHEDFNRRRTASSSSHM